VQLRLKDRIAIRVATSGQAVYKGARGITASFGLRRIPKPEQILVAPQDMRISDPTIANDILGGQLLFGGRYADAAGRSLFGVTPPSLAFAQELHGFGWLRHFRGFAQETAGKETRRILAEWIQKGRETPAAHEPEVMAHRVIALISHSPMILAGATAEFHGRFLASLGQDIAALYAGAKRASAPSQVKIACAMLYASLACKGLEPLITPACDALVAALQTAILPDGCHRSRNPARTMDICFDLLPLKQALGVRERALPTQIAETLSSMVRFLRTLCHRDGRLATFNGAGPIIAADLSILLAYDRAEQMQLSSTGASRYLRLDAGRTTLFLDGGTPPGDWSSEHHFAPLALEWSHFNQRIVVSCGAPPAGLPDLAAMARRTSAHSTLIIDDADLAVVDPQSKGPSPILRGTRTVSLARLANENWTLVDASHDGYKAEFGSIHHRKIAMAADGLVLAGEDRLEATKGRQRPPREALLRFHLAPEVRAEATSSGLGAALDAGAAGVWLFSVEEGTVYVEESVVFATFRGRQRSSQLVIPLPADGKPVIWRFTRMRDGSA
jgi:uncharacterized heparinase superfamily protein